MKVTVVHSVHVWLRQTQTWMYNQVRYLPKEVEAHVVCERTENLDQFWVPNIHNLKAVPGRRYYWEKGLRKLGLRRHLGFPISIARRYGANIIHSHFGNGGWRDIAVARRAKLKHVVTFYGRDVNYLPHHEPKWRERYKELFEHVDAVLCEGTHMAQCITDLGCPSHKVNVHHLGVEVENIPFKPRQWRPGQALRVLIAASFREKKGIPYALEALGHIQREVPIEITIIGDADPSPRSRAEKRRALDTIEKYGMKSKVRLMGYQPHTVLFEEAYNHHIFLSPSVTASDGDTEGGAPVSIIEMAATGMPIVSTKHCDIPSVIKDGLTGFLAEERDVEGLVEKIEDLLAAPPAKWREITQAGREYIAKEYNVQDQGIKLACLYKKMVAAR